jgi:TPR repeat protein
MKIGAVIFLCAALMAMSTQATEKLADIQASTAGSCSPAFVYSTVNRNVIVNCDINKAELSKLAGQLRDVQRAEHLSSKSMQALVSQTNQLLASFMSMNVDVKVIRAGVDQLLSRKSSDVLVDQSAGDPSIRSAQIYSEGLSLCAANHSSDALKAFEKSADLNFAPGQFAFANLMFWRWNVKKPTIYSRDEREKAFKAVEASAASGYPAALEFLALAYGSGSKAPGTQTKDHVLGQGDVGQFFGLLYSKDLSETYMTSAAKAGDGNAANLLGIEKIQQRQGQAAKEWFRRSGQLGCPLGYANLWSHMTSEEKSAERDDLSRRADAMSDRFCKTQYFDAFACLTD